MDKKIEAFFWVSNKGNEPVRAWLLELPQKYKKIIGSDIATVEYRWYIGLPWVREVNKKPKLWEVRSDLGNNNIARVIFCVEDGYMYLLHGFIKKTQKLPKKELDIAIARYKSLRQDC